MKCAYYQKQKQSKMTTKDKKHLNEVVNDFMQKSIVVGPDEALKMIQKGNKI